MKSKFIPNTVVCWGIVVWQVYILCPFLLFFAGLMSPAAATAHWEWLFDFLPSILGVDLALAVGFVWTLPEENK